MRLNATTLFAVVSMTHVHDLPAQVLEVDRAILYCAIVDRVGHIVTNLERQPPPFKVSRDEQERSALYHAIRDFKVPSWAEQFGKIYYNVTRHEKVIGSVIRLSRDYLMIVAFEANTNNFDEIIMKQILPLIE